MEENKEKKVKLKLNKMEIATKAMAIILSVFMILSVSATFIYYFINR